MEGEMEKSRKKGSRKRVGEEERRETNKTTFISSE